MSAEFQLKFQISNFQPSHVRIKLKKFTKMWMKAFDIIRSSFLLSIFTHYWRKWFLDVIHLLHHKHNNLSLLKLCNKNNGMFFFQFCSFVFNADFDTKHVQFLINKSFPNFWSKDIEVDLPLYFCIYVVDSGQVIVCLAIAFFMWKPFTGQLFSNSDLIRVTCAFFVIWEQLFVCHSPIRALCKRISQSESRLSQLSFSQSHV